MWWPNMSDQPTQTPFLSPTSSNFIYFSWSNELVSNSNLITTKYTESILNCFSFSLFNISILVTKQFDTIVFLLYWFYGVFVKREKGKSSLFYLFHFLSFTSLVTHSYKVYPLYRNIHWLSHLSLFGSAFLKTCLASWRWQSTNLSIVSCPNVISGTCSAGSRFLFSLLIAARY